MVAMTACVPVVRYPVVAAPRHHVMARDPDVAAAVPAVEGADHVDADAVEVRTVAQDVRAVIARELVNLELEAVIGARRDCGADLCRLGLRVDLLAQADDHFFLRGTVKEIRSGGRLAKSRPSSMCCSMARRRNRSWRSVRAWSR